MTAAVLAGAGLGIGLWLLVSGFVPAREPLATSLDRLGRPIPQPEAAPTSMDARLGSTLRRIGFVDRTLDRLRGDLRILRRDPNEVAAEMFGYGLIGLLWAPIVVAGGWMMGLPIPGSVPAWLSLVGAVIAVVVPYRQIRENAADARTAFGHALSAYCDVCAMAMSAGREVYAAMFEAASAGDGWVFDEIRDALQRGFLAGDKPWESLEALGEELALPDLSELAATIALAGGEGAAVRDTIASKARSIRERLVTDAEKRAGAATERMAIPGAMLMLGFVWFLVFPSLALIFEQARP